MISRTKLAVAALSLFAASLSASPALAWGCIAVAADGTYGYSYNFGDRGDAEDRALNECTDRTGEVCEIVECDPNT